MTRPINLSLIAFRFPIPAIASILHRISGIALLFGVGYLSYLLSVSLDSAAGFEWVQTAIHESAHGYVVWLVIVALLYHFVAGIRHLLLDFHIGTSLTASRVSSWAVLLMTVVLAGIAGWWLFS